MPEEGIQEGARGKERTPGPDHCGICSHLQLGPCTTCGQLSSSDQGSAQLVWVLNREKGGLGEMQTNARIPRNAKGRD